MAVALSFLVRGDSPLRSIEEVAGEVLPRDEARAHYEDVVQPAARNPNALPPLNWKDPGLLEETSYRGLRRRCR